MVVKEKKINDPKVAKEMMKKSKPIMIICFVIAGVLGLLSGLIWDGLMGIAIIPLLVGIFFFIKYAKGKTELKRIENIICKKCGHRFDKEEISYKIKDKGRSSSNMNNNQIKVTEKAIVEITCSCKNCGNEQKFDWGFIIGEKITNAFGAVLRQREYPLDDLVFDLFKS